MLKELQGASTAAVGRWHLEDIAQRGMEEVCTKLLGRAATEEWAAQHCEAAGRAPEVAAQALRQFWDTHAGKR